MSGGLYYGTRSQLVALVYKDITVVNGSEKSLNIKDSDNNKYNHCRPTETNTVSFNIL